MPRLYIKNVFPGWYWLENWHDLVYRLIKKSKARGREHFEPSIVCCSAACQRERQSRSLQRLSHLIIPPLSELRLQAEAIFGAVQKKKKKVWSCIQWTVWSDNVKLCDKLHMLTNASALQSFLCLLSGNVVGVNEIPFLFHAVRCITYNSDAPFTNKTWLAYMNVFSRNPLIKAPVFTDNLTYSTNNGTLERHGDRKGRKEKRKNKSVSELHPCQWETSFLWNLRMTSCETPAVLTDSLLRIHRLLLLRRRQV